MPLKKSELVFGVFRTIAEELNKFLVDDLFLLFQGCYPNSICWGIGAGGMAIICQAFLLTKHTSPKTNILDPKMQVWKMISFRRVIFRFYVVFFGVYMFIKHVPLPSLRLISDHKTARFKPPKI